MRSKSHMTYNDKNFMMLAVVVFFHSFAPVLE